MNQKKTHAGQDYQNAFRLPSAHTAKERATGAGGFKHKVCTCITILHMCTLTLTHDTHVCKRVCANTQINISMSLCMYLCMYVWIGVCVTSVCMCIKNDCIHQYIHAIHTCWQNTHTHRCNFWMRALQIVAHTHLSLGCIHLFALSSHIGHRNHEQNVKRCPGWLVCILPARGGHWRCWPPAAPAPPSSRRSASKLRRCQISYGFSSWD